MSQFTPVQGWSELLLALPEFILVDAHVTEHDELVADVELPRDDAPCLRYGVTDTHSLHDYRAFSIKAGSPGRL